jgi:hypothetical protein
MAPTEGKVALGPKRDTPKIYFQKLASFSPIESMVSTHHVLPRIHHKLTIKKPHPAHAFFKIPLKKRHFTTPKYFSQLPT